MLKKSHLLATVALTQLAAFPALAQDQTPNEGTAEKTRQLSTVVVLGTKRSGGEIAQDAPLSVTAFDAKALDERGINNLADLDASVPNTAFEPIGTVIGVANFTIRGQGFVSSVPSTDPTVGVFVDGIFLGTNYGVITDSFDLESVEVLRGPQGVLFGRNVTGGAVLMRSRRPDGESRFQGKVGLETGLQYTVAAAVEGSLVEDKLAGKISVYHLNDDGYFENVSVGRDTGKIKTTVIKPILVFTPNDQFDTTAIWEHGETTGDGPVSQRPLANDPPSGLTGNFDSAQGEPGFTDNSWDQFTLESNLTTSIGEFTNIFGYRAVDSDTLVDIDSEAGAFFHANVILEQNQISDELRVTRNFTDSWEFMAGLYYFSQEFDYQEYRDILGGAVQVLGGGTQEHTVKGIFVNNVIDLSDQFTLSAGVRYSEETKKIVLFSLGSCDFNTGLCLTPDFEDKNTWTSVTPKVNLQWNVTEDINLYALWAKGFRSGGYNFRDAPGGTPAGPFAPEKTTSYEVGAKTEWFDNTLRINAAAFFNEVEDLQRTITRLHPVLGNEQLILNAGDGEISGFELEFLTRPTDRLEFGGSLGLLHFEYTDVREDLNNDGFIDEGDKSLKLLKQPKTTYSVNARYSHPLDGGAELYARADYGYRAKQFTREDNTFESSTYRMLNAAIGYKSADGRWAVRVYGKNLLNDVWQPFVSPLPFAGTTRFTPINKGERYGAELTVSF